jgi:hypothetical protein
MNREPRGAMKELSRRPLLFVSGIAAALLLFLLSYTFQFPAEIVLALLGAFVPFSQLLVVRSEATKNVEDQEQRVKEVEREAEKPQSFPEYFRAQLRVLAERARLLMVKAESRANLLYAVGTMLTVACIFAPLASVAVYSSADPLPVELLERLKDFRAGDGTLPKGITISVGKDWHILASGMSFGFLFLAAAGALFSQHRRQMETFFLLARDVDYFDGVAAAAEIRERADQSALSSEMRAVVSAVLAEMLRRPVPTELKDSSAERDETPPLMGKISQALEDHS